ncbi:MAG: hypothetical protein EOP49_17890 [Sphingobacteriales bacterium]|nr:MAG: hypothetical protein EOP49_17890 [Sphingobacteriales bacterium]
MSKSKTAYKNDSWDLVDKMKDDKGAVQRMSKEELPAELKDKSRAEIEAVVAVKTKEREKLQKEIETLSKQRQAYIDEENRKTKTEDDLGAAITTSIIDLAKTRGYISQQ